LKAEIERLELEYNENISKEQAKYNMETNKLKDQIFENEVNQKTLEKEVSYLIYIFSSILRYYSIIVWIPTCLL
jgi:hypothetical protein